MNAANITENKMKKSKVLIIMPVFNQLHFTKQMIESLREFTPSDAYEILIIDNGSTDGTVAYLTGQESVYNNIHCIFNPANEGWTGACNQAFDLLIKKGPDHIQFEDCGYILLANNDILFEKDWLSKMLRRFDRDPKVGIVGPTSDYVAGMQTINMNQPGIKTEEARFLIGFFFLMQREVLEQVGKFDEETFGKMGGGEEIDFCIRAKESGWKFVIARDVFIKHFGSKTLSKLVDGEAGSPNYINYCAKQDDLIRKKWGEEIAGHLYEIDTLNRGIKVGICLPMRTDFSGSRLFWISLLIMRKPVYWEIIDCPRQNIQDARNLLAQHALQRGMTHVLFVDDDHIIPQDAMIRLLEHDVDMVGALAFKRRPSYDPCVFNVASDPVNGDLGMYPVPLIKQGLQEVSAIGFSMVLIKKEVFEKVGWPYFMYGDKSLGIHTHLGGIGEDMSFCIKAGRAGIKVHCDTDLILPHLGDQEMVTDETYLKFQKENEGKEIKPKVLANGMVVV
jgi:GT2 family glycosyltransferase